MKHLFSASLIFVFASHMAWADEPYAEKRHSAHSTESPLSKRLKKALGSGEKTASPSEHRNLNVAPEKKSPLGFYLDIEFRGKQELVGSMHGEPTLRKPGLVEIYGQRVDEKMDRTESMLLDRCKSDSVLPAGQVLKELAQKILAEEDRNLKNVYQKKILHSKAKPVDPKLELPVRRLALIAFLIRENAERRAQRIPEVHDDPFELALGSFESEFWENFAGPFEGEHAHERLRLRSQGKVGMDLLQKYDELIADMTQATEVQRQLGLPKGGSGADEVIGSLASSFRRMGRAGCLTSDAKKNAMESLAQTIGSLDWTERNRGMVLDFILGEEAPKPPIPEPSLFHKKNTNTILESEHLRDVLRDQLKDLEIKKTPLRELLERSKKDPKGF